MNINWICTMESCWVSQQKSDIFNPKIYGLEDTLFKHTWIRDMCTVSNTVDHTLTLYEI